MDGPKWCASSHPSSTCDHCLTDLVSNNMATASCTHQFARRCMKSSLEQLNAGMKLLQRHRRINEALKEEIAQIHALQIARCQTPDQASQQQQQ